LSFHAAGEKWLALLRKHPHLKIDDNVVNYAIKHFPMDVLAAVELNHAESALGVYELASKLPATDCKEYFKRKGYNVSEELTPHSSVFLVVKDAKQMVGKQLKQSEFVNAIRLARAFGMEITVATTDFETRTHALGIQRLY
jgi:hypothetical protein